MIEEDEAFDNDISVEDLAEELPDTSPRYVVYSYKYTHKDGRVSYPLIFIYYCPSSASRARRLCFFVLIYVLPQMSSPRSTCCTRAPRRTSSRRSRSRARCAVFLLLILCIDSHNEQAFDVRKKSELTEEWLLEKLSYFR